MTTTTVEVERTVTESEELHLCDECHREIDENGMEYHPPNYVTQGGPTLHFCSECLNNMTDGEVQPAHVERAEDWLDTKVGVDGDTIRQNVRAIRILIRVSMIASASVLGAMILSSSISAFILTLAALLAAGFASVGTTFLLDESPVDLSW